MPNEEEFDDQISFSQSNPPALASGLYTLGLSLQLTATGTNPASQNWAPTFSFYVTGPRFTLAPQEVYSIFPPDQDTGASYTTLPSITLNRSTLPWERSPNQPSAAVNENTWLALLLFQDSEMDETTGVSVSNMTLSVYNPPGGLQATDDPNSQVSILSIPTTLAASVLPAYTDLEWTAHIRQATNSSEDASLYGPQRAVVLCNRLPLAGVRSCMFLVSLENQFVSNDGGETWSFNMPNSGNAQLPVLFSWQFTCNTTGSDFLLQLENLNQTPGNQYVTPRLPAVTAPPGGPDPEDWLSQGYVPLPHTLRSGESTVSWFHGPLGTGNRTIPLTVPAPSSDALLIYDQTTGMFDAGYAAAWEAGRLLALQDQAIAMTLYKWKQENAVLDAQMKQVNADAHLPVANVLNRQNQIGQAELAFLRLNQQQTDNTFTSLGDGTITLQANLAVLMPFNDTFGVSPYFPYNVAPVVQLATSSTGDLFTNDFTFSFWFRNDPVAMQYVGSGTMAVLLEIWTSSNMYVSVVITGGTLQLGLNSVPAYGQVVTDTDWHHIMLSATTASGDTAYVLYLDGVQQATLSDASADLVSFVMVSNNSTGTQFYGNVANLRLFTEALDATDANFIRTEDLRGRPLYPFFNNLALLKGVPFNYLINNEQMLPQESIRFFVLDQTWLNCLLDGAFSLGRINAAQLSLDEGMWPVLGFNPFLLVSGFILRSQVISNWDDMEVDGYSVVISGTGPGDPTTLLPVLRAERLSQNVVLCLFSGQVQTVDIHLKNESLHSGVDSINTQANTFKKVMRNGTGVLQPEADALTIDFKNTLNVIDMSALADTMDAQEFFPNAFTSAQLGMEMTEGVPNIRFTYNSSLQT